MFKPYGKINHDHDEATVTVTFADDSKIIFKMGDRVELKKGKYSQDISIAEVFDANFIPAMGIQAQIQSSMFYEGPESDPYERVAEIFYKIIMLEDDIGFELVKSIKYVDPVDYENIREMGECIIHTLFLTYNKYLALGNKEVMLRMSDVIEVVVRNCNIEIGE